MEKNGKGGQKRRIVMNDGSLGERQNVTGSAPEAESASRNRYSGELSEKIRWKFRDMNS
jgi:hypothetical protein